MKLTLILVAGTTQGDTCGRVDGTDLTISGKVYPLGDIEDGALATAQGDHPFIGPIRCIDGVIHAAVLWVYDPGHAAPHQPVPHPVIDIEDGEIPDPVLRKEMA